MALFNSRKRSTSPSYVSTSTTLIFIALCVFGVWMISSNYGFSPQTLTDEATSTSMAIDTSSKINNDLSSTQDIPQITTKNIQEPVETTTKSTIEDSAETNTNSEMQKDTSTTTTVFEDNPGHLPDDAIKSDDKNNNNEANKQKSGTSDSQMFEESSVTQKEQASSVSESGNNDQNSESEKVQQSSVEASEGNAKGQDSMESQNANEAENKEQNLGQKQDVQSFDTRGSKNNEDEANKEQLIEDKGDITKKDGKVTTQDENVDSKKEDTSQVSQSEPEKNENQGESAKSQDSKAEKKGQKSKKAWATQADQSHQEKKRQQDNTWYLCNVTAGADYIPCLDNEKAIKMLRSTKHFQHRERHCPEDPPTCLVPLPENYKTPIQWPSSRDKIWYHNVPHTLLAEVKGHQNWVKVTGEYLTFPGGGTQFIHGALHYIDFLQQAEGGIGWGKHTRVILDVGCGVGSFGGYLFERDVIAMSFAPKDEHEAQVQFALERGIPAISAVMGSQRLPFPSNVFDLIHCARCRVPWHEEGGMLLLELNRVLRPGGYFAWSATPVYQKLEEDVEIWNAMSSLTKAMCWDLVTINKDKLNHVGAAIYRKPISNECYERREKSEPPMCKDNDDPNAAWYVPLQACIHKVPVNKAERGAKWPEEWPHRLHKAPYWLNNSQLGIYKKPAATDFSEDSERWKNVVDELSNIGITWSNVRNVMDMKAVYGGFAAALRDLPAVWVFNVVNIDSPDTLPIIYERGLFGIYHDWCESFSTYPRTYDLLHADNLFSKLKERCKLAAIMAEVDRIARPGGKLVVRDESSTISEVAALLKSLQWEIISSNEEKGILSAKKGNWRPDSLASS
ncbi:PREDICTED: probable methyltransferase PMT27 [Lupinus angustifolius]|uniref:probable methyltransferase PMT27 n=1 Tax=Lupinus angustifolius TaxID=3871 RepID=UPI00092EB70F|nr:PREDICTED: probable methyltransferase PMT27 [Lupinus angustifolius]XP_019421796.1 PREDICTED: probable methyltransferase PMT27 [Lupinus angustifolius]